jgi:hypothetical protein
MGNRFNNNKRPASFYNSYSNSWMYNRIKSAFGGYRGFVLIFGIQKTGSFNIPKININEFTIWFKYIRLSL